MVPTLLHPIPVLIRQLDADATAEFDDLLHEPVGQVRRFKKPVQLVAQHSSGDTNRPNPTSGGVTEESMGYLLFRTSDLRDADVVLQRGDRVVQLGDDPNAVAVDYYITKIRYLGHYQDQGGATLVRAYYEDRQPVVDHG